MFRKKTPVPYLPGQSKHVTHVFSASGDWCYICGAHYHPWKFWQRWSLLDHDEPF
jgi:hypothetical protein